MSGWSLAIKLGGLARSVGKFDQPVQAAIESMNGARFVHDRLELAGREVLIGDAQKVKGLGPLACKTDRIDVRVLKSFEDSAVWDFAGGRRHVTAAQPVQCGAMLSLLRRHSSRPSAS